MSVKPKKEFKVIGLVPMGSYNVIDEMSEDISAPVILNKLGGDRFQVFNNQTGRLTKMSFDEIQRLGRDTFSVKSEGRKCILFYDENDNDILLTEKDFNALSGQNEGVETLIKNSSYERYTAKSLTGGQLGEQ